MSSFAKKLINVQFDLAAGGGPGQLTGFRVSATITRNTGPSFAHANIAIYGLPLKTMNSLSRIGRQIYGVANNKVTLYAGDSNTGMALAFVGVIQEAYVDANPMPQVAFRITANTATDYWAVTQQGAKPISKQGSQAVVPMLSQLAQTMGFVFQSNGANVNLRNPYYPGNPLTQALQICRHANLDLWIDKGVMSVTPVGQAAQSAAVLISKDTIEVGYPSFRQSGVIVKSTWNPNINVPGNIQIQSDLTPASGTWQVNLVIDEIESLVPHGRWFSTTIGVVGGTPIAPS